MNFLDPLYHKVYLLNQKLSESNSIELFAIDQV